LQEGEFSSVGGRVSIKTDVRVIAATHHNLAQLIQKGKFREDLYFRLNVVPIAIPPLRERVDDIPELANFFLRKARQANLPAKSLSPQAEDVLKRYAWPGNVRELENFIQRLTILAVEEVISPELIDSEISHTARVQPSLDSPDDSDLSSLVARHLRRYFKSHQGRLPAAGLYDRILGQVEKPLITQTLESTGGNQIRAATILGLNRNTLRKKIRELGIDIIKGGRQ
jgi:two-component system nitrogen regulation response regulator GlnG